ncbi:hypothetical protein [Rhizobium sp. L1K21]|uniref:hypothetical protein n=1 Tax=Rhizobium sp. L1K21 TaxID=2954933 RepID=UPI002093696B|nr:hypothetical protein [Rhizobium sp. L1K21]MCO6184666.1 hypothetical protein [Rhizobium sp. L1K21]
MDKDILSILIADDQPLIAMELERILNETMPCTISICHGSALGSALQSGRFDLVFVDAAPLESGYSHQFAQINKTGAGVVFLSSYPKLVSALSLLSPRGIIEKPFDEWEIRNRLNAWIVRP